MIQTPAPTPAPIHDIVDALEIFPYPLWMMILVGIAVFAMLALAIWFVFFLKSPKPPPTPREKALAALVLLKASESREPYEFAVAVSEILRRYLDEAFGLRSTTATSIEFLESLRNNPSFSPDEKASLAAFLEQVDLLKFARVDADRTQLDALFAAAERFVRKPLKPTESVTSLPPLSKESVPQIDQSADAPSPQHTGKS